MPVCGFMDGCYRRLHRGFGRRGTLHPSATSARSQILVTWATTPCLDALLRRARSTEGASQSSRASTSSTSFSSPSMPDNGGYYCTASTAFIGRVAFTGGSVEVYTYTDRFVVAESPGRILTLKPAVEDISSAPTTAPEVPPQQLAYDKFITVMSTFRYVFVSILILGLCSPVVYGLYVRYKPKLSEKIQKLATLSVLGGGKWGQGSDEAAIDSLKLQLIINIESLGKKYNDARSMLGFAPSSLSYRINREGLARLEVAMLQQLHKDLQSESIEQLDLLLE